ncbi:unnamed protein product [Staurois parvus]|uniref:Uncharacterized protein n=1 Tax=Staurois parvus TaxID=386267 RepID=A0ABN9DKV4_9NEOB|nr:unnamed protein product [Staurois parvus]
MVSPPLNTHYYLAANFALFSHHTYKRASLSAMLHILIHVMLYTL